MRPLRAVRSRMTRRTGLVALAVVVVLALVAGAVVALGWWRESQRTELERAARMAPDSTLRLSWTDWAAVRAELDVDLDASASGVRVDDFLDAGFERDLTSTTALQASAATMQERFGFSPATLEWEAFTQSEEGALVTMRLPESTDFDELADTLAALGYTAPQDDDGVWRGGSAVVTRIGGTLSPELQHVALLADERLVLTSDTATYLETALAAVDDEDAGMEDVEDVVVPSGEPLSAVVYTGDQACRSLAMSQADQTDQSQADELVRAAGGVHPLTGFAMSIQPDDTVRAVLALEDDERARSDADSRATLATGPAPGQGGDFADRFALASATAEGRSVILDLEPGEGEYVLSDLSSGPVLFATC
ncbi:hypothetical protein [Nocardioides pacificus]